jgi:ectoine hydroxylase-related dioxygenase (phytanoyl-CoA dioxygenase family)
MNELDKFKSEGYIIFNIEDDQLIDSVNEDVAVLLETGEYAKNSKIYSYSDSPRIVESWIKSDNCRKLATHVNIMARLQNLFQNEPKPFSTINFLRSTCQPLHSDYVHFGTVPEFMLAGAWVALEDIDPRSGPLQVVPKSHRLPRFRLEDYTEEIPKSLSDIEVIYKQYEHRLLGELAETGLMPITPSLKKGDCIIWSANTVHGSPVCQDASLSRRSQVTHYVFGNVEYNYSPLHSRIDKGRYARRQVTIIPKELP